MILNGIDQINSTIVISNFQAKCVVEALRLARMIEMYHVAEALHKAGFKTADSTQVNSEIQNVITTLGAFTDNFIKITKEDNVDGQDSTVTPPEAKPVVH